MTTVDHTTTPGEPLGRDLQAVVDAAVTSVAPAHVGVGEVLAFVVPAGGRLATVDRDGEADLLAAGLPPRRSVAGTTTVYDERGLIELAERWGDFSSTVVYADPVGRQVTAVLDDDRDGTGPGWRARRVRLNLVHTPEWERWARIDGTLLSQHEFAEHVEACLEDIRTPTAADMLEIAQSLEATTDVTFQSGVRLASGQRQFTYREDTTASAGGGDLTIPDVIELGLVPWQGRDARPFLVKARLRYRVSPQGLRLGVVLVDVDRILRTAFEDDVVTPIREAGLRIVNGTP